MFFWLSSSLTRVQVTQAVVRFIAPFITGGRFPESPSRLPPPFAKAVVRFLPWPSASLQEASRDVLQPLFLTFFICKEEREKDPIRDFRPFLFHLSKPSVLNRTCASGAVYPAIPSTPCLLLSPWKKVFFPFAFGNNIKDWST